MKIHLLVIGRDRKDPIVEVSETFVHRIRYPLSFQVTELKEAPAKKNVSKAAVMKAEGLRILDHVDPATRLVALERTGRLVSSTEVAEAMDSALQDGLQQWAFVIGGPYGLHADVLDRAHQQWSLSKLTLPHRLARLLLCEQIYRAQTILRGEPYHK